MCVNDGAALRRRITVWDGLASSSASAPCCSAPPEKSPDVQGGRRRPLGSGEPWSAGEEMDGGHDQDHERARARYARARPRARV